MLGAVKPADAVACCREDSITLAKRRLSHENLEDGLDATDLGFDAQADQTNQHAVRWGGVLAAA